MAREAERTELMKQRQNLREELARGGRAGVDLESKR